MEKAWLNLSPYRLHLFLERDKKRSGNHRLVIAGRSTGAYAEKLQSLGFARVNQIESKYEYWICTNLGIGLGAIQQVFDLAKAEMMHVEKIMPQLRIEREQRVKRNPQQEDKNGSQLRNAPSLSRPADQHADDAGATGAPILGQDGSRSDVQRESGTDGKAVQGGEPAEAPGRAAGNPLDGSPQAGEGVAAEKPGEPGSGLPGARSVAATGQAGGTGDTDRPDSPESEGGSAGSGLTVTEGGDTLPVLGVEFLAEGGWYRSRNSSQSLEEVLDALPADTQEFADMEGVDLHAVGVQIRVVDDTSGQILYTATSTSLSAPSLASEAGAQAGEANAEPEQRLDKEEPEAGSEEAPYGAKEASETPSSATQVPPKEQEFGLGANDQGGVVVSKFPSETEEVEGPRIERAWQGATLEMLREAQQDSMRADLAAGRAFEALKKAEQEGVSALPLSARKEMLRFSGWGGIASSVRTDHGHESKNYQGKSIAKSLGMDVGTFNREMLANRLESYYTPAAYIDAIWQVLTRAGIPADGRFFEPGCGSGLFFAGAPEAVQRHGRLVGVECDPMAFRLARVNAPDATIINTRFESAVLDRGFDAVIGNVPFGETLISDSRYEGAHHIHDYFILRSLDHIKPGGMMAVITSSGTLDKKDSAIREQMMARANLVAAYRLPDQAFADQSASVVTDILVLQRRPDGAAPDYDFSKTKNLALTDSDGELLEFPVNQYFHDHPENVIGDFKIASSQFGPKLTVGTREVGLKGYQLNERLAQAVLDRIEQDIPAGIALRDDWPRASSADQSDAAQRDMEENESALRGYEGLVGDIIEVDGRLMVVNDIADDFDDDGIRTGTHHVVEPLELSANASEIARAYIPLRSATRELIFAQLEGSDELLASAQEKALDLYQTFVARFGPVNSDKVLRVVGDDAGSAEVCALEFWDDEKGQVTQLADVFTKRVVRATPELSASTPEDAYFLCMDSVGRIDFDWMEKISGIAQAELRNRLIGSMVFVDPVTEELMPAASYLSGNVVKRLAQAKEIALLDDRYVPNVKALEAVQPAPIPFEDITIRLGVNWIPADDIRSFAGHLMGRELTEADLKVRYIEKAGVWVVDASNSFKRDFSAQRTSIYGTERASFEQLLEKLLNNQRPTHTFKDAHGKVHTDEEATLQSRSKQDELNDLFYQWVAQAPERVERFSALYNENCNVIVVPKADGTRLTFPGLAPTWKPKHHQMDMVAMAMMGHNDMAAHPVGAGKTFEMVAIAMKLGQLGMHEKPMIAVPNHMLGQISREAKQMYPGARVLMVTADDLRGKKRKRFLAMARNNKWDIVVCTHSMLNQISAPLPIQEADLKRQIAVVDAKLSECDNRRTERTLQARLKTLTGELEKVSKTFEDDQARGKLLTIDQLGIDAILVDEAHLYKNLALNSSMSVLGVTTGGSARAGNLAQLGEYLRGLHGRSFGLHFFTGTPIANSMCELYVHNRILRPELLDEMGIYHFDEWANRFGDVVSALEALPEGGGFRSNERFARFVNLPEMIRLFRTFADVRTKEQLNLPTPEVKTHVISVPQSEWQAAFMKHLAIRATAVRNGDVDKSEDNMLSISTAGRKAALDMRLMDHVIPEDSSLKLDAVAENVLDVWERTADVRGTQLAFMDLGTPGKGKEFSCYDELRRLLVERGIPEHEIAFIHDAKSNDQKEQIFSKVRSGEIRVLIGSTEKMGVGTNVQERLAALHNVDCPWRPSDIEQRIGRIARQGNLFFEQVEEFRYTTKDSFDLFMWETNKRKATFISQALADPDSAAREVSDEMDLGYAEVMWVTTGNPKIREKVELDDQVIKLERKYRAWLGDRASKGSMRQTLERDLRGAKRLLAQEEQIRDALPKSRVRVVTIEGAVSDLQDGSASWLYATPVGVALNKRLPLIEAKMMRFNETEMPLNMRIGDINLMARVENDVFTKSRRITVVGELNGQIIPFNDVAPSKNDQIFGRSVRSWYDTGERSARIQVEIDRIEQGLSALAGFDMAAAWPYEDDLEKLKARKRELDAWFATQNFDNYAQAEDPYLKMLAEHRSQMRAGANMADEIEVLPASGQAFSEWELQVDAGAGEDAHKISGQRHMRSGMR